MIDINELRDRAATFGSDYLTDEEWVEVISRLEAAEKSDAESIAMYHRARDERNAYKAVHNDWIAKTEWVQEEITRGDLPAKYLGMHRADGIRAEILRLRKEIANIKEVEFPRKMQAVADAWKEKCEKLQAERDALRAKIKQMERQESIGTAFLCVRCSTPFDGDHHCPDCGYHTAKKKTVYALPGAKGE